MQDNYIKLVADVKQTIQSLSSEIDSTEKQLKVKASRKRARIQALTLIKQLKELRKASMQLEKELKVQK